MQFDFSAAARENGRATAGTEIPPRIVTRLTADRYCILGKDCCGVEQRTVMLAAILAVTNAYPEGVACCCKPHIAAEATARQSVHHGSPACSRRLFYSDLRHVSMFRRSGQDLGRKKAARKWSLTFGESGWF
jgi:hypothetical protein